MPSLELLTPHQDIHLTTIQITMEKVQRRFLNLGEESQLPRNELASLLNILISGFHGRNLYFSEAPPNESDAQPCSEITGLGYTRQKSKETSRYLLKQNASHSPYSMKKQHEICNYKAQNSFFRKKKWFTLLKMLRPQLQSVLVAKPWESQIKGSHVGLDCWDPKLCPAP